MQLQITSTHFNNDYFEHMNHPMSGGLEWKVIAHIPLRLALGFKDLDNNNDLHIHDEHVSEQSGKDVAQKMEWSTYILTTSCATRIFLFPIKYPFQFSTYNFSRTDMNYPPPLFRWPLS